MTDLSVITVNWNTCSLLRQCLVSLFQSIEGISYEVFVVDNGSSDRSPEMITQEFPVVHLLQNHKNLGFSKANNQAILKASGRYILLLNSDTKFTSNALQKMVTFMDQHPSVGIAGTKLLNPDGTRQYSCDLFPRRPLMMLRDKLIETFFGSNRTRGQTRTVQWNFDENFAVDYVIGAVFLIRRETLEQVGLLDEQFFMYAEDIDYCYRAALLGWETYYLGKISVYHYNRGSSEKFPELASRLHHLRTASLLKFYRKHYGMISAFFLKLALLAKNQL